MAKLSDLLRIEEPNEMSSRYGKAFERAVFSLLKGKDVVAAMSAFIKYYGEPHTGAFAKLMKLKPWAMKVAEVEIAPPVFFQIDRVTISVQADFLVKYIDGKKELVELKSHILRKEEWKTKAEWSLAAKVMRMAYRRNGYNFPLRLIYFAEIDGVVRPEEEVFVHPNDEKDDETLINVLKERLKQI